MTRTFRILIVLLVLAAGAFFLLTGSDPWVAEQPTPSAREIQNVRAVLQEASSGNVQGDPIDVSFDDAQLRSLAALASQGLPPNRFKTRLEDDTLTVTLSRPFWFRWLNVQTAISGESEGFPELRMKVGAVRFPGWLSRKMLNLGHRMIAAKGVAVQPLDKLVQSTRITDGKAEATLLLPEPAQVQQAFSDDPLIIDPAVAADIYCRLTEQQRGSKQKLLEQQLGRALAASSESREQHAAALVALAMFVVDPTVGRLAGVAPDAIETCKPRGQAITLQGRADWAKHWSLSAALAVTTGDQFANSMGEWKELADSGARSPKLAPKDPSGFSFADLSADRSGMLTARRLTNPSHLVQAREWAMEADGQQLLPEDLIELGDGIGEAEFKRQFGGIETPRFLEQVEKIDRELRKGWDR
ncbi:hypothetical protein [Altererythrobacter sp.]|uniref:hypothetical protein n=1 Tax=Altererythrobacter sp. TaxID=1872480 RepID=UPI003D0E92A8